MKKSLFIILLMGLSTLKVFAPEKEMYWDRPQYITTGRNMVFHIYPKDYHSRKIENILKEQSTIK